MANKVYYIGTRSGHTIPLQTEPIERTLDPLGDWVRFNEHTWFLSTDRSAEEVSTGLQRILKRSGMFLVIALDPAERFGLAPSWVWDWIDSQSDARPKTVAEIVAEQTLVDQASNR